jgi:hypothetical protein
MDDVEGYDHGNEDAHPFEVLVEVPASSFLMRTPFSIFLPCLHSCLFLLYGFRRAMLRHGT